MTDTTTLTLAGFLLARIAEDEATARAATEDDCGQDGGFEGAYELLTGRKGSPLDCVPRFGDAAAALILRTAVPRRVLRECEAKRRIVGAHEQHPMQVDGFCRSCGITDGPCATLRALALPYADHPDYRQEWRP